MQTDKFEISLGNLGVTTRQNRGHTPEELAAMAVDKIDAFKNRIQAIITFYVREGINNHICTVCNELEKQGHKDLANIIRRI